MKKSLFLVVSIGKLREPRGGRSGKNLTKNPISGGYQKFVLFQVSPPTLRSMARTQLYYKIINL